MPRILAQRIDGATIENRVRPALLLPSLVVLLDHPALGERQALDRTTRSLKVRKLRQETILRVCVLSLRKTKGVLIYIYIYISCLCKYIFTYIHMFANVASKGVLNSEDTAGCTAGCWSAVLGPTK